MKTYSPTGIYADLGVRPIINCQSQRTSLGGSLLSQEVELAMKEANSSYVIMAELMNSAGSRVAELMGVEAAYITSGCAAALTLSAAACMTGSDPEKRGRLPNTTGMNNEIVIQKAQRYGYDRSFTVAGAVLVEAGEQDSCSVQQFKNALGPKTAAVAYLVEAEHGRSLPFEDVVDLAHTQGIPVIADAAAQIYPIDYFRTVAQSADLVCFGGKFFGAPNATGFVCGRRELVESVAGHGYIAFQSQNDGERGFGRPMKVDRQSVVALLVALSRWLTMNHEERLWEIDETLDRIKGRLDSVPHVSTKIVRTNNYWQSALHLTLDVGAFGKSAEDVARELDDGDPRIWVGLGGGDFQKGLYLHDPSIPEDTFVVNAHALKPGEDEIVAERIENVLLY
ncbi:MAG: aminotransferase class V-fold PLP-dependent enzyme [SAR202 cluster bacterium]|nr:aminotransferase class V-fold PLP-dependent enzyme [SAR202 cluster bacterium]